MSTPEATPPHAAGNDPSMDDILASIRRILAEDESADPAARASPTMVSEHAADPKPRDVLELDSSMIVGEQPVAPPATRPESVATTTAPPMPEPPASQPPPRPAEESLVAPEAAAASTASVGSLVRHLANERSLMVTRNGPSLEDVIRDEIRPLLKNWLDTNLPALVERQVRAEIARLVDRAVT